MLHPCQNSGTCFTDYTTLLGYDCLCPTGFSGTDCEYDYRACQPDTCWNNGIVNKKKKLKNHKVYKYIVF